MSSISQDSPDVNSWQELSVSIGHNGNARIWHDKPIPIFPTPDQAQRERIINNFVNRAVDGDLAHAPLDSIGGWLLMYAGLSQQGAQMWLNVIAHKRAAHLPSTVDILAALA